jgi:hypothetical protein
MSLDLPARIETRDDALAFIKWCVIGLGTGYHPDTPMRDYDPPFSPEESARLEVLRVRTAELLAEHLYAIALRMAGWTWREGWYEVGIPGGESVVAYADSYEAAADLALRDPETGGRLPGYTGKTVMVYPLADAAGPRLEGREMAVAVNTIDLPA